MSLNKRASLPFDYTIIAINALKYESLFKNGLFYLAVRLLTTLFTSKTEQRRLLMDE